MDILGLKANNLEDVEKRFLNNIFKIELLGLDYWYFSVVDILGLFYIRVINLIGDKAGVLRIVKNKIECLTYR
ncbi:P-loop containing nucleoside triphosphate hydrolase protein [Penicillium brevicompactum]|uniref:P-loop containing nucleoside triphosphate hydrolase protein n=1 Tax=Penicillium brevicompactum TaxID=5074 RepID=A0A9W9QRN9_PENBR|nr:P-loop containing nucleoside triphosphate hydrolase protein [Penicillium brevicompactum]